MSIKKIEQTRANKLFRPLDIVVYGAVAAVAVILLVVFVILPKGNSLTAGASVVEISSKGEIVFSFDFGSGAYEILDGGGRVELSGGEKVSVTVFADEEKRDYNIIAFDLSDGGSVRVLDTNCSRRHDCTYMEISSDGGSIVCIPHELVVYTRSSVSQPQTG